MKGRKPRKDELELWRQVARDVVRLPGTRAEPDASEAEAPTSPPAERPVNGTWRPLEISGGKAPLRDDLAPTLQQRLESHSVAMDRRAFRQLRRGKLRPEARIDLHGMTLERAHGALNRFVMSSHASGRRLILVITGKGKQRDEGGPIPTRHGVLRHQVPEWLRLPPLATVVLQVTEAHVSHGGGGAYYVYLKRSR